MLESGRDQLPTVQQTMLFELRDLCFAYPGQERLFDGLSLTIPQSEIVCLVGQNGCGKSSLLHLLRRGLRPQAGHITFLGKNLVEWKPRSLAQHLAMVHQRNRVPGDLTVEELVRFGRSPHGPLFGRRYSEEDERAVDQALKDTDLLALRERPAEQLSGGQAQRLWLAMALAQDTPVLFLDEATSFLDVRYQLDFLQLVQQLKEQRQMSIVMVLHDINQALAYSDRIIALKAGKLMVNGPVEEFLQAKVLETVYDHPLRILQTAEGPVVKTF